MGMILELCEKMEVNGKSMPQVSFPEGWELRLLGELATIFSGGTPNRKNPEYWDGDIPWITTTLIDGSEIFEANEFITQNGLKGSSAKWCKAGTILMAMYGQGKTRGKVALLGIDATINQACAAIELSELCSKEYVLHLLISKYEQIRELSNSGGQENLSSGIIKRLEVLIPPKKEQIIIAKVLSDTNALITEFGELIAKKQAIKTATMQQLLTGRTRLPQFSKHSDGTLKGHRSSELGAIPEDWQVVPFKNVLTIKHGKNQKEVESPSGQYPIYATGGQIGNATSFLFDKPSVLIGRKGTIDKPRYAETPFWTVDTLFYNELKKNFCVNFIY
ncbi:restriction endonuclease subunit S [Enterobacter hormaechei]|uniref:restriction endonuclease subunit S n=1 Tax=Enterobacter hormaechei TaxID=158836 RepID=UPI001A569FA6|nr:restriction endonuclease subunit S [Enterobacter hormaechei]